MRLAWGNCRTSSCPHPSVGATTKVTCRECIFERRRLFRNLQHEKKRRAGKSRELLILPRARPSPLSAFTERLVSQAFREIVTHSFSGESAWPTRFWRRGQVGSHAVCNAFGALLAKYHRVILTEHLSRRDWRRFSLLRADWPELVPRERKHWSSLSGDPCRLRCCERHGPSPASEGPPPTSE